MSDAVARTRWPRRLGRSRNVVTGALIVTLVVLGALFAGAVSTHNPRRLDPANRLKPPSAQNYLGTDEFGRDVWSLVVHGSQVSLLVGATTMALTSLGGSVVGLVAGYYRRLDLGLMRVDDGLLAEAILGFLGVGVPPYVPSWGNVIASGKNVIREAFWVSLFPGLALTLSGLGLNLLGDGLRDTLDPRLRVP